MIKDRGNKKWTALMLTEHREALRELKSHENDIEKPVLDEQAKERLDTLVREAFRDQFTVRLTYYQDRRLYKLEGKLSLKKGQIYLDGKELVTGNIIDIELI